METTILRVDARPGWEQWTMRGWRSKALSTHMDVLADAALQQFSHLSSVTVTAQQGRKSKVITYHRQRGWTRAE